MRSRRDDDVLGGSPARFVPVDSAGELEALFEKAIRGTTFLFLHDPYCPISNYAYEEVERVDCAVNLVDVSRHSALSKLIQLRTGIRHESPQAIVFKDGVPSWHASHGRITAVAVRKALDEAV
jgi:bacillithiol system protein YtxJ